MVEVILEKMIVCIGVLIILDVQLNVVGEVFKFDGFLKVYLEFKDEDEEDDVVEGMLLLMKVGQELNLDKLIVLECYIRVFVRFIEVSLVSKLEELGIGCLSIYVLIIFKIMEEKRGYIIKGN